ncbi:tyrosine-type recombinase/integrase [Amycolatopsis magusensis]|uniref:tyrosine-type recombinase/integrase n=1 Tax=Amycolatopsis magusensis TaxID=882444 RepID=UPI0037B6D0E8
MRTDDPAVLYLLVGPARVAVEPVQQFLRDFAAQGCSPSSVRSYAYVLLRWWRWLLVVGVEWNRATPAEVGDFVLWLPLASKPERPGTTMDRKGAVNPITRKRLLDQRYQPRTVRHSNAVVRSFYEYWIDEETGPLINPVQLARGRLGGVRRVHAHQNPLEPVVPGARLRYNPRVPKSTPRAMSDERWAEVFGGLRSHRDRALLALAVSNGARASELLGMRLCDVDWGEQKIRVVRKGSRAEQWLPASAESFVWLHLYLASLGSPLGSDERLWWTLRRRERGLGLVRQPLTYDALRAVLRRVNAMLGTNWSMHDLRRSSSPYLGDANTSANVIWPRPGTSACAASRATSKPGLAAVHQATEALAGPRRRG